MKKSTLSFFLIVITSLAIGLMGCARSGEKPAEAQSQTASQSAMGAADITKAVAVLHPTTGNDVHGVIYFAKEADGVHVSGQVEGLTPGEHGFHIHQFGDCSAPNGTSAGGHFNPTGAPHGSPQAAEHHIGDMGNITANDAGVANIDETFSFLTLSGANTIIGRGLIVHQGADDLTSQPTGNAGGRVACGVIGVANTTQAPESTTKK